MYCFSTNGITPLVAPQVGWFDNDASCAAFPVLGVGQVKARQNKITIYPNPATTELEISADDAITSLLIKDLLGQTVCSEHCNASQIHLNISGLQAGVYFININGAFAAKFAKQ